MPDFALPVELEAHEPPEARGLARDGVRLLVTPRDDDRIEHAIFSDLPKFLRAGDLIVANVSGTLPAALTAVRPDGSSIALHFSTRLPAGLWVVEPRKVAGRTGEILSLPGGATATLLVPYASSSRLWIAHVELPEQSVDYLFRHGRPIRYPYVHRDWPIEMYQTLFASAPGSAEMPSAGRAFTPAILRGLEARGIGFATLTLHTGVASLENDESPYEEYFDVPAVTAARVNAVRAQGGRVIAVGTTVVRALETSIDPEGHVIAARGWTDLLITPGRQPRAVDGLITGFHEPRATHLWMLESIAGHALLARAYRAALDAGYLWHEFGDMHLIV